MEEYSYSENARLSGIKGFILAAIIFLTFIIISLHMLGSDDPYRVLMGKALMFMLPLPLVAGLITSYRLYNSNESWNISIDDEVFSWHSPSNIAASIEVKISEIESVTCRYSDASTDDYYLTLRNGDKFYMPANCHVEHELVARELERRGVSRIDKQHL